MAVNITTANNKAGLIMAEFFKTAKFLPPHHDIFQVQKTIHNYNIKSLFDRKLQLKLRLLYIFTAIQQLQNFVPIRGIVNPYLPEFKMYIANIIIIMRIGNEKYILISWRLKILKHFKTIFQSMKMLTGKMKFQVWMGQDRTQRYTIRKR